VTAGMKPIGDLFAARAFWLLMPYRCNACGRGFDFYLEEGCEGPRDVQFLLLIKAGPRAGQRSPWYKTASGRVIVPVPFVAGGCPTCQGAPPWKMNGPCLMHTGHERVLQPRPFSEDLPALAARFHYPKDLTDPQACGIPIYPPYLMRGAT